MKERLSESPDEARRPNREPEAGVGRKVYRLFDSFAGKVTLWTGSPVAFTIAFGTVLVWAISGPLFGYSETWQLVINTGTTIITFLMVFLIQQSQNKDSAAVHLKLNELIASHAKASNRLICIEDLDEEELQKLTQFYRKLGELAEESASVAQSHSLSTARELHKRKHEARTEIANEGKRASQTSPPS